MAGINNQDDDEITGINVTPLVDVMLVLLIIFMVTANYIVNQSINVQLPKASETDGASTNHELSFVLGRSGELYLNGERIDFEGLELRIQKEVQTNAEKSISVLISADQFTPHGQVVKLIDTVRKSGITDFAINVEAQTQ